MSEVVERMAVAMHARFAQEAAQALRLPVPPSTWEETDEVVRRYYRASARVGIEMLREPTPTMVETAWLEVMHEDAGDVWRVMIDAALSSPSETEKEGTI